MRSIPTTFDCDCSSLFVVLQALKKFKANLAKLKEFMPEIAAPPPSESASSSAEGQSLAKFGNETRDGATVVIARARVTKSEALIIRAWKNAPLARKALVEKQVHILSEADIDATKYFHASMWKACQDLIKTGK
jgi:hypothetical protein